MPHPLDAPRHAVVLLPYVLLGSLPLRVTPFGGALATPHATEGGLDLRGALVTELLARERVEQLGCAEGDLGLHGYNHGCEERA